MKKYLFLLLLIMLIFIRPVSAEMNCTVNGASISCNYTGTITPTFYRWEISRNGFPSGDTGWCSDCDRQTWSFDEDCVVEIKLSINDSTNISISSSYFTIDGVYIIEDNASIYENCNDCTAGGYYWYNNSCHNCTKPQYWNEETENLPAKDIIPESSKPIIGAGVIFALLIVFAYYFNYKRNYREIKNKEKKKYEVYGYDLDIKKVGKENNKPVYNVFVNDKGENL